MAEGKKAPAEDLKDWWSWLRLLFWKIIQEDGGGGGGGEPQQRISRTGGTWSQLKLLFWKIIVQEDGGGEKRPQQRISRTGGLSSNCSSGRLFRRMAEGKKTSAEDLKDWGSWLRLLFWKIILQDGRGKEGPVVGVCIWGNPDVLKDLSDLWVGHVCINVYCTLTTAVHLGDLWVGCVCISVHCWSTVYADLSSSFNWPVGRTCMH